jgi:hypothetical protein
MSSAESAGYWSICKNLLPKEEIIYISQVILIYAVVISCVINLTIYPEQQPALWSSLLAGALGYILPSPTPGKRKRTNDGAVLPHPT